MIIFSVEEYFQFLHWYHLHFQFLQLILPDLRDYFEPVLSLVSGCYQLLLLYLRYYLKMLALVALE